MFVAQVIFAALLLVKIANAPPPVSNLDVAEHNHKSGGVEPSANPNLAQPAKLASPEKSKTPPELISQLLTLPTNAKLTGREVTLLETLSAVPNASRQLDIIRAYWQLSFVCGEYHIRLQQMEQLTKLDVKSGDEAVLNAAKASGKALLKEAELSVMAAQYNLASLAMLPTDSELPLPADRPHVGPYRTNFNQLFGARPAPEQPKLIAHTMPVRCRAIDAHAAAVAAAENTLEASLEAYKDGKVPLEMVLSFIAQLDQQQRSIVASVCNYNHDIANYAMSVIDRPMTAGTIVAMLIEPINTLQPLKPISDTSVRPTVLNEPLATPPKMLLRSATQNQPTLTRLRNSNPRKPTLAPPKPTSQKRTSKIDRTSPKPADTPDKPINNSLRIIPIETLPTPKNIPTTTNKPTLDHHGNHRPLNFRSSSFGRKSQAGQLAQTLYSSIPSSAQNGKPMSMIECLDMNSDDQLSTVTAYWEAGQRAVECRLLDKKNEKLKNLVELVVTRPNSLEKRLATLHLTYAMAANQAARLEAEIRLSQSRFKLIRQVGQDIRSGWLLPITPPRWKKFSTETPPSSPDAEQTWKARRLTATILALAEIVQDRAVTAAEASKVCSEALSKFSSSDGPINEVLARTDWETDQLLTFLQTLTDYNLAISEYSFSTLPSNVSNARLVAVMLGTN